MYDGLENYNKTGYGGVTETWNFVQQELECCGVVNSTDWSDVYVATPASCCANNTLPCNDNSPDLFTQGCLSVVEDTFVENFGYVAGLTNSPLTY